MRISDTDINRILDAANIVDVIKSYVTLRKSGSNFFGCCPFHDEATASMCVSPAKRIYKCFGCGEGGDAIHFIEKVENKTFIEAVKTLAQRANVEIEQEQESAEAKQKRLHKEALWIAN